MITIYPKNNQAPVDDAEEQKKFDSTWESSRRILFHCKTVFPFDFFPDEIIIDENKIDIIYGLFIASRQVNSIPIKKIISASSTSNLIFGELEIELETYHQNPIPIKYLWNKDAVCARRIINGLVSLVKQNVDLSKLDLTRVKKKVEEIGSAMEHLPS